jgi:hypothetical protein
VEVVCKALWQLVVEELAEVAAVEMVEAQPHHLVQAVEVADIGQVDKTAALDMVD